MIHESEIEDFHALLESAGYSKVDFELSTTEDPYPPRGGRLRSPVTVKYKKTGSQRTYDATRWYYEAYKDLVDGKFEAQTVSAGD